MKKISIPRLGRIITRHKLLSSLIGVLLLASISGLFLGSLLDALETRPVQHHTVDSLGILGDAVVLKNVVKLTPGVGVTLSYGGSNDIIIDAALRSVTANDSNPTMTINQDSGAGALVAFQRNSADVLTIGAGATIADLEFQQAAIIRTTAGNLSLTPGGAGSLVFDPAGTLIIHRTAGTDRLRHSIGAFAFQEPTIISAVGNLTLTPTGNVVISGLTGGDPTNTGDLRLERTVLNVGDAGGLEFLAVTAGNGFGWLLQSPDLLSGNIPLVFLSRDGAIDWTERLRFTLDGAIFQFGQSTAIVTSAGDLALEPAGNLRVGVGDNSTSVLIVSGAPTPSDEGSEIRLEMAADHDTTFDYWFIDILEDDFRVGQTGFDRLVFNNLGTVFSFQQAIEINTTAGDMKLDPSGNIDLLANYVELDQQAAPANPASGTRRLYVDSGTGELSVRTSGGSTVSLEGAAPYTTILKAADETVNNSATLQDDDDFTFSVDANGVYRVEGWIVVNSSSVADWKVAWSLPSGASGLSVIGDVATTNDVDLRQFSTTSGISNIPGADSGLLLRGTLIIDSTAGTATLQWAQRVAEVSNTIVRQSSWLTYEKLN